MCSSCKTPPMSFCLLLPDDLTHVMASGCIYNRNFQSWGSFQTYMCLWPFSPQYTYTGEDMAPFKITTVVSCSHQWEHIVFLRCAGMGNWLSITDCVWLSPTPLTLNSLLSSRPVDSVDPGAGAHTWPTDTWGLYIFRTECQLPTGGLGLCSPFHGLCGRDKDQRVLTYSSQQPWHPSQIPLLIPLPSLKPAWVTSSYPGHLLNIPPSLLLFLTSRTSSSLMVVQTWTLSFAS